MDRQIGCDHCEGCGDGEESTDSAPEVDSDGFDFERPNAQTEHKSGRIFDSLVPGIGDLELDDAEEPCSDDEELEEVVEICAQCDNEECECEEIPPSQDHDDEDE